MHYLIVFARCSLLFVSMLGYYLLLAKKIQKELVLGLLFSGIGSFLFLASILHCLVEASCLIVLVGLVLILQAVVNKTSFRPVFSSCIFYAVCASILFFFLVYGSKFTFYDNFSHWATVLNVILKKNNLPNISDTTIMFQSYPTGSATFIYFICKIVGVHSEWMQMFAQAILLIGLSSSLFVFINRKEQTVPVLIGIFMLLCSNFSFFDLLVDTLLPLTAVSAFCFCIYYKDSISSKLNYVAFYTIFLVSIKNSGALFAAFIYIYIFICLAGKRQEQFKCAKNILLPAAAVFLWQKHFTQAFDEAALSKHSMSLANISNGLHEKSKNDLLKVFHAFFMRCFSFENSVVYLILAGIILYYFLRRLKSDKAAEIRKILILAGGFYCIYQIGMLAMFLTTMPIGEASRLAGYNRYHKTILIFVSALFLIGVLKIMDCLSGSYLKRIAGTGIAVVLLFVMNSALIPNYSHYIRQNLEGTERARYDALIEEYEIGSYGRYLVLVDETTSSDYLFFMTRYLLSSADVHVTPVSLVNEDWSKMYDYVIAFDKTEDTMAFMKDNFGDADLGAVCLVD